MRTWCFNPLETGLKHCCLATVVGDMAEPGAVPTLEVEKERPEAPSEVKSKLSAATSTSEGPGVAPQVDKKFDRQPVFLVMSSGQIESAEV